ncbi:MAG TPA: cytochrome c biogenesis protein CcdA [Leptospiraceae bacterium]|nr:cytochrome c biogenesis protein CcdA [Leptospiraceae bacterium]
MENISLGSYFILSAGFGFLALITPCVFPLIPITVSYFLKRSENENRTAFADSFIYGFGIVFFFTVIGLLISVFFGAAKVNRLAADPYLNLLIGTAFIAFALNLWGAYEIQLPASLTFFLSRDRGNSGFIPIIFMSLTFSLTTFTCTMPFLGTVLVSASKGNWLYPLIGMLGYSLAFALPFFLLSLFPSFLKKLPRSGNWLIEAKAVLGFLELGASVKFFSNADLVWNLNLLSRDRVLIFLFSVFIVLSLYLFGVFRFSNESEKSDRRLSPFRILFSIFSIYAAFFFYSGMNGKGLGEWDAFLPPPETVKVSQPNLKSDEPVWLSSREAAFREAEKKGKTVFIDFTGYSCTNCRWMEQNVFTLPEVKSLFSEFVLLRLYTDGDGPENDSNQEYQEKTFGTIALPLYVGLTKDGKVIESLAGMTREKNDFIVFLKKIRDASGK